MFNIKQQIPEAWSTPGRKNVKNTTHRHIIFKLQKIKAKEKILKEARGKRQLHPTSPQKPGT